MEEDWIAVKRIFQYLQGTKNYAIHYQNRKIALFGYSDASYAETEDRKSTSGFVFMKNGGAITWRSKKQSIVSLSSMEAEYIALCDATKEATWLQRLEHDVEGIKESILILEDNQSTINTAKKEIFNFRTKHIDVRFHFVREKVEDGTIKINYCPTTDMVADTFTKPLGRVLFQNFRSGMGLIEH